jgi:hypothetical protein
LSGSRKRHSLSCFRVTSATSGIKRRCHARGCGCSAMKDETSLSCFRVTPATSSVATRAAAVRWKIKRHSHVFASLSCFRVTSAWPKKLFLIALENGLQNLLYGYLGWKWPQWQLEVPKTRGCVYIAAYPSEQISTYK